MLSVIVPTVRPQNIPKLKEAVEACGIEHEFLWEEDVERIGCPLMVKKLVEKSKYDLVVFLGDDTLPDPDCFKNALKAKGDYWLLGFNDGNGIKATHWMADKRLLEHLPDKEFFYTKFKHNFCDDFLRTKAQRLGKYTWVEQAKVKHNHPAFKTAPTDEHYERVKPFWEHDKNLFKSLIKLSVCMIVKNEEAMLDSCLESVKEADEIIIVDTGSTDKTKEVAAKYTDKIYDFPWVDDFAAARNEAVKHATGDWILSIDADEILEAGGIEKLRNLFSSDGDGIWVNMTCGKTDFVYPRCFRNAPNIRWEGRIHELPTISVGVQSNVKITYGTSPAHKLDPDLDFRILKKHVDENPNDSRALFYLAREYYYRHNLDMALLFYKACLDKSKWMKERADAYLHIAIILWKQQKGDEAREACLHALLINSNFKAAARLMKEMSWDFNKSQWEKMELSADNRETLFAYQ